MRKKLAFSGFILATCASAIMVFFVLISGIVLLNVLSGAGAGRFIAGIVCMSIFFIATLVLNATSISSTTNSEKLNKRKGLVITTIVFNFLVVLFCIYSMAGIETSGAGVIIETSGGTIAYYVVYALAIITSNVLIIVDLARNGKIDKNEVQEKIEHKDNSAYNNENDYIEKHINKLIQLKEKNLITEEEFNELKKHTIEKKL